MAEGARLESVYTFIAYRGFESLSLRQIQKNGYAPFFCNCSVITFSFLPLQAVTIAALKTQTNTFPV